MKVGPGYSGPFVIHTACGRADSRLVGVGIRSRIRVSRDREQAARGEDDDGHEGGCLSDGDDAEHGFFPRAETGGSDTRSIARPPKTTVKET